MPEMDGITFLKQVRATDKSIPFIMFTGRGREEIAIEAFENGADFYLQKGGESKSQFAELAHKIHAAVDHRRADMQVIALSRLYTVLSATNKAIVRVHDKTELINEICRIVVDIGGFTMAWAGRVNDEKHLIEPVAVYGHIDGYLDMIAISTDDIPRGRGPTGTAFRTKTFTVCNDIASDPEMAPWREGALERGYRSLAAFPFALDSNNAGVVTVYASEPGFFTDQIIRLLDEQSRDLSFAFVTLDHEEQRIAAENDLKKSELQYRRLFETAQDAILILDGDTGEIIDANTFILELLGYPLEYCIGKYLWELGFVKDKSIAQQAYSELKTNGYIRYEDLPLETKDGRSIDVEFVSNAYLVGDKKIFQCNIRDITERKRAEKWIRWLASFPELNPNPIIEMDAQGTITFSNVAAQENLKKLGLPENPALFIPEDKEDILRMLRETNELQVYREITLNNETFAENISLNHELNVVRIYTRNVSERKRAEEALRETNEYLHKLIDFANAPIIVWDPDFRITRFNHAFEHLTGRVEQEVIGQPLDILFPEKTRDTSLALIKKTLTGERWETVEIPILASDGTTHTVLWNSANILTAEAELISTIAQGVDITERKRAEVEMKRSFERFKTVMEGLDALVYVVDMETFELLFINKYGKDVWGEVEGQTCWKTIQSGQSGPCPFCTNDKLVDSNGNPTGVYHWEFQNTVTRKWYDCRDSAIRWLDGHLVRLEIATDITDRKQMDEALKKSEDLLKRTGKIASIGGWELDAETLTVTWTEETYHIHEVPVGQRPTLEEAINFFHPDDRKKLSDAIQRALTTGEAYDMELRFITAKGKSLWTRSLCQPQVVDGKTIYLIGTFQDITERKKAEEAMRKFSDGLERMVIDRTADISDINQKLVAEIDIRLDAEKQLTKSVVEKEVLLREVHHRVKNNLQIVISLLNLQSRYITDETTRSAFVESQNRVRAMALVHEKLYQSTDLSKIDLSNYLTYLGNSLFQFFGIKGKGIMLTMDIRDISLATDTAIPLGLMINELISNSLKYAFPDGRKGEVSVTVYRQAHTLTILFKDNGVGIPADLDWRNTKSLGLRLVISLVEQLDGTIELDRSAGTVFKIVVNEKE